MFTHSKTIRFWIGGRWTIRNNFVDGTNTIHDHGPAERAALRRAERRASGLPR